MPSSPKAKRADRLDRYRSKRDFAPPPEPGGGGTAGEAPHRGSWSRSTTPAPALGPAPRARRRARLVGGPQGHPGDPERNHLAVRDRGPPARVPRVRGRHPGGPVRRRHDEDLGPRHLRVRRSGETRKVMVTFHGERVRRPLRPVPDPRRRLDDPPHGSARGSGPRADARAGRADARARRARSRATTAAGRTRSSGTACARSATSSAGPAAAARAATATTSRALPGAARARRGARLARADPRRRDRRVRRAGRPSFASSSSSRMHLTSEHAGAAAVAVATPSST